MLAQSSQQSSDPSDTTKVLNEILIQGGRIQIPFSELNRNITVINRETIDALPVKSAIELLQYVAGIDVRQRGPQGIQADIGIDGGTFDQTLVLLNGVKITDPQTGHNMMNLPVSTNAIERIEIIKGAAARIYGIHALNGAINIVTRQPQSSEIALQLSAGSSFEKDTATQKLYSGYAADFSAALVQNKVKHFISASHAQSNGYRYNTAFLNDKIFYQNHIDLGKSNSLKVMGGYVYNDFGANAFYAAPADKESKETVQTMIAAASLALKVNPVWTFRPRISYRWNKDDYIFNRVQPNQYRNIHKTEATNVELNNSFTTAAGMFGLGAEIRNEVIRSNSLGDRNRMNYGLFAEYNWNTHRKLSLNTGAYVNYNSDFGWEFLPGIDIGYEFSRQARLFVNAGTGQRLPSFTDLFYKGPSNIGNDQLNPERSLYGEIGFKYHKKSFSSSVSYFQRTVSEFIDWVKEDISDPWQPQNFQEIKTHGVTFSADYRLENQTSASLFSLNSSISYTWLLPKIKSADPDKISQYALDNLRNHITLRNQLSYRKKYYLTIGARYEERIRYQEYVLFDIRVAVKQNQFEIFADGNNLSNVSFIEAGAVPMVGRWVSMGIKWHK